ncbi:MAG: hypothetical protein FJY21_00425 [Bacteroidetes bacterium]|nr:hypothetical protein [Bacteroidota bacterium]
MKKILVVSLIALILSGCGVSRKISLLEQCRYDIKSADSIYFFGRDLSQQIKTGGFDLGSLPELAIGVLRKDIPLRARINLGIDNPGSKAIEINQFDYVISFKGIELVNGTTDRRITIQSEGSTLVPIKIETNIYSILSERNTREEILSYLRGANGREPVQKSQISIKIRPSIRIGKKLIKYPAYITMDKELNSNMFR